MSAVSVISVGLNTSITHQQSKITSRGKDSDKRTGLCLEAWEKFLDRADWDRTSQLQGTREGCRIVNRADVVERAFKENDKSATCPENRDRVEAQIKKEVANGHYVVCDNPAVITSALGTIPKAGSDKIRLTHDCSCLVGKAVNDYAVNEAQRFQTVQGAFKGKGRPGEGGGGRF